MTRRHASPASVRRMRRQAVLAQAAVVLLAVALLAIGGTAYAPEVIR